MWKCYSIFVLLSVCYNYLVLIIIIMYSYMINIIIIITHNINSYIYDNKLREDSIILYIIIYELLSSCSKCITKNIIIILLLG